MDESSNEKIKENRNDKGKEIPNCGIQNFGVQKYSVTGDVINNIVNIKEEEKSNTEQKLFLYEEIRKSLQAQLQTRYRSFQMPKLPWMEKKIYFMEDYYVELALLKKDRSGFEMEEHIAIDDILNSINGKHPFRVLIQGNPGYGKTTIAKYLAHRWATHSSKCLSKFDLVFVLEVRYLKEHLLEEIVKRFILKDVEEEDMKAAVKSHPEKILFILDGFDEVRNVDIEQMINSIWFQEEWSRSTVVLTSRPSNTAKISKTLDKNIIIKGIVPEKQRLFLLKYLGKTSNPETKIEKLIELLDELDNKELLYCPLILLLLGLLLNEQHHLPIPQSRTEIYQDIFDFLIRRSLHRQSDMDENVDLFGRRGKPTPQNCIKILQSFGKFSLEMLIEKQLTFSEASVLDACGGDELILNLGIFFKNQVVIENEEMEYMEVVHKTFLEFAAAFYLSSLHSSMESHPYFLKYRSMQPDLRNPVYKFLVGFLGENYDMLFRILQKNGKFQSTNFEELISLLAEVNNPYEKMKTYVNWLEKFTIFFYVYKKQTDFFFRKMGTSQNIVNLYIAGLKLAIEAKLVQEFILTFTKPAFPLSETHFRSCDLFVDKKILCPLKIKFEDVGNYFAEILEFIEIYRPVEITFHCFGRNPYPPAPLDRQDIHDVSDIIEIENGLKIRRKHSQEFSSFLGMLAKCSKLTKLTLTGLYFTKELLDCIAFFVSKQSLPTLSLNYGRIDLHKLIVDQQIGNPSWFQNLLGKTRRSVWWNTNIQTMVKDFCKLELNSSSLVPLLPSIIGPGCVLKSLDLSNLYLKENELDLIYALIKKPNNLCSLTLCEMDRYDIRVDLLRLCNNGRKYWKDLRFVGISVMLPDESGIDLSCVKCIHYRNVDWYNGKEDRNILEEAFNRNEEKSIYVIQSYLSKCGIHNVKFMS